MTAVATVPALQPLPRNGWPNGSPSQQTGLSNTATATEDLSKMMVPRKSAQRSNSSSSIPTTTTSTSTISANPSPQSNGIPPGDANWASRKKPARGLWPPTKSEPVSALSTSRPQSTNTAIAAPSAPSPMIPVQSPSQNTPQQSNAPSQWQQNGPQRPQGNPEHPAILHLLPINGTFDSKTITVPFAPEILRIGRQTNQKTVPTPSNGYFDSKVLSRQHAEIWADREGKIWIRDVKSSNGTFVNGKRLSQENRDSEPHTLKEQDVLELGIDIVSEDQKTVVHHKVAARVEHAGFYGLENNALPLSLSDLDPSSISGVMGQTGPTARSRASSQGSNAGNGRYTGPATSVAAGGMAPPGYHGKWLQPITMEQIVKRINFELRHARQLSSDLCLTGSFVDVVMNEDKSYYSLAAAKVPSSANNFDNTKSLYASPPPAPPPTQPLPEAPPEANLRSKLNNLPALQPLLRRSDTERPKITTPGSGRASPTKSGPGLQIRNLMEALSTAQKEISSQNDKIKEVEETLRKERQDRKSAEDLFPTTKSDLLPDAAPLPPADPVDLSRTPNEPDVIRLQMLVETMRAEMEEMKVEMERYRQRAETAEDKSQRDRETLAEMVESIRKREELAKRRKDRKRAAPNAKVVRETVSQSADSSDEGEIEVLDRRLESQAEMAIERLHGALIATKHARGANGTATSPTSVTQLQELGKAAVAALLSPQSIGRTSTLVECGQEGGVPDLVQEKGSEGQIQAQPQAHRNRAHEQLVQSAPYASLIGVVLLGVGMMAYLNGWQKVVDR